MVCTDCPPGTYAFNEDEISECRPCPVGTYSPAGATSCTDCPAGTYNDQQGRGQCIRCSTGTIATNTGAPICNVCPSGVSNSNNTECESASLLWLAGVGAGVGVLLMLGAAWTWWASSKMRRLRKQFSNDNVAVECAAAIARLDLQAVAWLSNIPKPNCIQLSFIRIMKILDEVRKYVPDQLLQRLAAGDEQGQESDPESGDAKSAVVSQHSTPRSCNNLVHMPSALGRGVCDPSSRQPSQLTHQQSICSLESHRLFLVRKVTYMLIRFDFCQHEATASQAEQNMGTFLSHVIDVVRAYGGTVGSVMYDHAVIHWGTTRTTAEAPTRAVETAFAIAAFTNKMQGGSELVLNIAIGVGNAITGVVETATNHFFVVGGGQVPLVQRMATKNWQDVLGVQILITDAVRTFVQFSISCLPRLVEGESILWEPVARKKEKGADEWMYQLEGEEQGTVDAKSVLAPFVAVCRGDFTLAESLIRDLLQQCQELRPTDIAALRLLASNASVCTKQSL
eukprot:GGOE01063140.1.p1 GENE.GGOE01063140.1~~GGOE01063140.1.p1  ORF type:complete len:509 (+),score=129.92 GGOE01063140.1:600-2126(+)